MPLQPDALPHPALSPSLIPPLTHPPIQQLIRQRHYAQALTACEALLASGNAPLTVKAQACFVATLVDRKDSALLWLTELPAPALIDDVEALMAIGAAWFKLDHLPRAIAVMTRAFELDGHNPMVQARLGSFMLAAGQVDAALPMLQFAVHALPSSGAAALNMARAFLALGQPLDALQELTRSAALTDRDADLYVAAKAEALSALGRADEAEAELRQAVSTHPTVATVQAAVSLIASRGKHEAAATLLKQALDTTPLAVPLMTLAAQLAQVRGRFGEAVHWIDKALKLEPDNVALWVTLCTVFPMQQINPRSREAADKALALTADTLGTLRASALTADAHVLAQEHDDVGAEARYRQALESQPACVPAMSGLGNLLLQLGRVDEASELFHRMRQFAPVAGWSQLIHVREVPEDPQVLEQIENLAHRPSLEGPVQSGLLFTTAQAWERKKEHDRAWQAATQANQAECKRLPYEPAEHRQRIEREIARFSAAFMASRQGHGDASRVPVFLLGMPRSGTTLVEQIMGSHSQVFGAGELSQIPELIQKLTAWEAKVGSGRSYPDCADDIARQESQQFAAHMLRDLQAMAPKAQRIVDKLPHNFEHIGLIKLMFPNATILHMRREPRDVAISNYFMNYAAKFGGMGFAYDLTWIGEQLVDHQRLMDHWHAVFPGQIMEVDYDDLVENTEDWARNIISHLGLEWEPGVLNFQDLDRAVKTASVWQVRQPIYKTSKAKWMRYEAYLAPLEDAMAQVPPAPDPLPLPAVAQGLFFDGMRHLQGGRFVDAETAFRALLSERPLHAAAMHFLGATLYCQRRLDEASAAMRESLQRRPAQAQWLENLIQCERKRGDTQAVDALQRSLNSLQRVGAADAEHSRNR